MTTFLDELAEELIEIHGSALKDVTVVLPSKRASLFLKKNLAKRLKTTFWAPQTLTFTDLVESYLEETILDTTSVAFELYEVYRSSRPENKETFDQFYKWGELLLSDFNQVDLYLIDPNLIFQDLRNIKELESWGGEQLTELQLRYLEFWNQLRDLYQELQIHLRKKGITYNGAAYRKVAQLLPVFEEQHAFQHIWFAGLNALSNSELQMIDHFVSKGLGTVRWDMDEFYATDPLREAGFFYRRAVQKNPAIASKVLPKNFQNHCELITLYPAGSTIGQVKIAAQLLQELAPIIHHEKCAVVLPDPALLTALKNELPLEIETANVTMGYPVEKSELFSLFNHALQLQNNIRKNKKAYRHENFHYQAFLRFIKHPLLHSFFDKEFEAIEHEIHRLNKVYLSGKEFDSADHKHWFAPISMWFSHWKNFEEDGVAALQQLINFLKDQLMNDPNDQSTNLELLYHIQVAVNRLRNILGQYPFVTEANTFQRLFHNFVRNNPAAFFGEPLSGLQIMGLLETRALDFEHVIVLSVNEGILPTAKPDHSILPYDLKRHHDLPGTFEKDAVLAYHFYRLIQRSKTVHLLHAPQSDDFGSGEKSRYLLQLQQEFDSTKITTRKFEHRIAESSSSIALKKDKQYYEQLDFYLTQKGLSISALNKYVRCPMDFYYAYICGLTEEDAVEEEVEASTMGSIVHLVLETIYESFENKQLLPQELQQWKPKIPELVETAFSENLGSHTLYGKNYLSREMAILQVKNVIEHDLKELEEGHQIRILGIEKELKHCLEIECNGNVKKILLTGLVDRIDERNGVVRVIDYKTGNVNPQKLKFFLEKGFRPDDDKAAQLAFYAWLYRKTHHTQKEIQSTILAVRNKKNLINKGSTSLGKDAYGLTFEDQFENLLRNQLLELYSEEKEITHRQGAKYCKVC